MIMMGWDSFFTLKIRKFATSMQALNNQQHNIRNE